MFLLGRERRRESKSKGRKAESEDDDIPSEDDVAEQDPYFQHKDDAFDDPFFKVTSATWTHFLVLNKSQALTAHLHI